MAFAPTLMCVHAHPDDEALFTAGITSHYGDLRVPRRVDHLHEWAVGLRRPRPTGIGSATRRRGRARHSSRGVAARRDRRRVLSVATLGYDDSGMKGWAQNDGPNAFMNADVDAVARTLAAIMDEERASVVVTYDENGFYGHPITSWPTSSRAPLLFRHQPEASVLPRRSQGRSGDVRHGSQGQGVFLPAWILDAGHTVSDDIVSTTMTYAPSPSANVKRLPRTLHKSTMPTSSQWTKNSLRCYLASSTTSVPGAVM